MPSAVFVSPVAPGFAGSSRASMQPQVCLFLHSWFCQCENKAAAAPVTATASFKTCSTPTLQISPKLLLSFGLPFYSSALLLCLLSFPFPFPCFCTTSFSNLHKIPPFQCLLLVCGCSILWLCLSVLYSVIKAPLCAQPRTAVFEWKGSPWAPLVLSRGDLGSVAM